jgi:hypothetical protein
MDHSAVRYVLSHWISIRAARRAGAHVLALASLVACGEGTAPSAPIIVRPGKMLGEFEGQRAYERSDVTLRLLVITETPTVSGLWEMIYSTTTANDEGTFTGTYEGGQLRLDLTVTEGCAGGYTAAGSAEDELGYRWNLQVTPSGECWDYAAAGPLPVQKVSDIGGFPRP